MLWNRWRRPRTRALSGEFVGTDWRFTLRPPARYRQGNRAPEYCLDIEPGKNLPWLRLAQHSLGMIGPQIYFGYVFLYANLYARAFVRSLEHIARHSMGFPD